MTETQLKVQVLRWLKTLPETFVYKSADKFTSGIPDLIICHKGRFVAIELKTKVGKVKRIQQYVIAKIDEAHGVARVCRSLDEVKEVMGYGQERAGT